MTARFLIAAVFALSSFDASAAFLYRVTYAIDTFETAGGEPVTEAYRDRCRQYSGRDMNAPSFGCETQVGDEFYGFFTTDIELESLADGNRLVEPSAWVVALGDVYWSLERPYPESDFGYFAGPTVDFWEDGDYENYEEAAIGPGFIVEDGEALGFVGQMFHPNEYPFIDYYVITDVADRFSANDGQFFSALGTYDIIRVAEPSTLSLCFVSLWLALIRRRAAR